MATLFLIPTPLNEDALQVIPAYVHDITRRLRIFIVENERTARRYLRKSGFTTSFDDVTLLPLDVDTTPEQFAQYMSYFKDNAEIGLMSEAGLPAIADPGSVIVSMCHQRNIPVIPLSGPSSILLALMSSGLNGQQFTFHGYIPVKQPEGKNYLQLMESRAIKGESQICIETPYRNNQLLQDILQSCQPASVLCIAMDITGSKEFIRTKSIAEWKKQTPHLEKLPAVFILGRLAV